MVSKIMIMLFFSVKIEIISNEKEYYRI
jgi:hypothetical protein